jgi:hypothetical protein
MCLLEVHLSKPQLTHTLPMAGIISERWDEIIRYPLIPFDVTARERELRHAYEMLAPLVRGHEAMKEAGIRR